MTDRIVYTNASGGVSVVAPAPGWTPAAVLAKDVPSGVTDAEILPLSALPDRVFRKVWRKFPGSVAVDLPAARDDVRERVRRARAAEFAVNDAAFVRAQMDNDVPAQAQARARAQQLRNAPADPAIDNAQSVDVLKAVRPAGLDWTRF